MQKLIIDEQDVIPWDKTRYASAAREGDYARFITEPTCIYLRKANGDEELKVVYDEQPDDPQLALIESVLDDVEYGKITRIGGAKAETVTFGSRPAHSIHTNKQSCSSSKMAHTQPQLHQVIADGSEVVARIYERYNPGLYYKHLNITQERVVEDYHMEETAFTSGIINKNNPLGYHYDKGNFSGVWSGMIVFKRFVEGGYLSIPEYNTGIQLKNRSLLLFDGQGLIHGVTPITKLHPKFSRRYSIVYYSLAKMWQCLPVTEELARANVQRMERERARLDLDYEANFIERHLVKKKAVKAARLKLDK